MTMRVWRKTFALLSSFVTRIHPPICLTEQMVPTPSDAPLGKVKMRFRCWKKSGPWQMWLQRFLRKRKLTSSSSRRDIHSWQRRWRGRKFGVGLASCLVLKEVRRGLGRVRIGHWVVYLSVLPTQSGLSVPLVCPYIKRIPHMTLIAVAFVNAIKNSTQTLRLICFTKYHLISSVEIESYTFSWILFYFGASLCL